ncbi:MAG: exonuclease subunit SbcD [Coprothermobacterota bacterium]|nr:exonuclease subunit SbcD [Coprothermobacterota bacterium]
MKLLHTADWHIGRSLYGMNRERESEALLEEIYDCARSERVDLVLVVGDLFDSPTPSNDSQRLVFDFFCRLSKNGIRAAIVAGNHDGQVFVPSKNLFGLGSVTVFDRIRPQGNYQFRFQSSEGEAVQLIALPYPTERMVIELSTADKDLKGEYAERVSSFLHYLDQLADPEAINLFAGHLMVGGARLSHTERENTTLELYQIPPSNLPGKTLYNALGHVHRHQKIVQAPARTYYAGSILRVDFSECGIEKGFYLAEINRRGDVEARFIPLQGAKPLFILEATADEYRECLSPYLTRDGYVKLRITTPGVPPQLGPQIRQEFPFVLACEFTRLETARQHSVTLEELADTGLASVLARYREFNPDAPQEILMALADLYQETTGAP